MGEDIEGPFVYPNDHRTRPEEEERYCDYGLTLRDWLAGMALQGMLANSGGPIQANILSGWGIVNTTREDVAADAYGFADAMLAARGK